MKLIPLVVLILSFVVLRPEATATAEASDNSATPAVPMVVQQEEDPHAAESMLFFDEAVEFAGPLNYLEMLNY